LVCFDSACVAVFHHHFFAVAAIFLWCLFKIFVLHTDQTGFHAILDLLVILDVF
jgi:hypothetical protein